VLSLYPDECYDWPHLDCPLCIVLSSNPSDGDEGFLEEASSNGNCPGSSSKELENSGDYFLYPEGAWCQMACPTPTSPEDICFALEFLCDKLGLIDGWIPGDETVAELVCRKIEDIPIPDPIVIDVQTCDLSDLALEESVELLCLKLGLDPDFDPEEDETLAELICRKIDTIVIPPEVEIIEIPCDLEDIEDGLELLCEKIGEPPYGTDLITKVCNIQYIVDDGLENLEDKICAIHESVGCDKRGKSVQQKLDKIRRQSVKNNKGIKKIYDQCNCD
jgi:hypothetical protein